MFVHIGVLDEMDFARFTELRMEWLEHTRATWLIQGAISEQDAAEIIKKSD